MPDARNLLLGHVSIAGSKSGGSRRLDNNPHTTRWGCFLPDLTRLASGASTANLPHQVINRRRNDGKRQLTPIDKICNVGDLPAPVDREKFSCRCRFLQMRVNMGVRNNNSLLRRSFMKELVHVFAGSSLDRVSAKRIDDDWVYSRAVASDTRYILFCNLKVHTQTADAGRGLVTYSHKDVLAIDPGTLREAVFLGLDSDNKAFFAVRMDGNIDLAHRGEYCDLRALAIEGLIPHDQLAMAGQAKAMIDWHDRHGFCSSCGVADEIHDGGYKRVCPSCQRMHFPRVDPVVIMLVIRGDRCLLGRSPHFNAQVFSALAGFMEPGETLEEAVRREISEEVGIAIGQVDYHSSQPWPFPSSIMIGCMAHAISEEITIDPVEIAEAQWFAREEARQILDGTHPDSIRGPYSMAIAHHLLKSFVENEIND